MTHVCPGCGAVVECDARLLGVGRRHPNGWEPSENHAEILKDVQLFHATKPGLWRTVPEIRASLNVRNVQRSGRRHANWWDADVQVLLSDLVGEQKVEMRKASRGSAYIYRLRA